MPPSNNQNPDRYERRQCRRGKHELFDGSLIVITIDEAIKNEVPHRMQLCSRGSTYYYKLGLCKICGAEVLGKRLGRLDNPKAKYRNPGYVPFMMKKGCTGTLNKSCYVKVPDGAPGRPKTKSILEDVEEDKELKEKVVPELKRRRII